MKPPRRGRRPSPRETAPPEIAEFSKTPVRRKPKPEADPIPEHIRKMLEAAYT